MGGGHDNTRADHQTRITIKNRSGCANVTLTFKTSRERGRF